MIKQEYKTNGRRYVLLQQVHINDDKIIAIYECFGNEPSFKIRTGYETQIVKKVSKQFKGKLLTYWKNPSNEDFGKTGWFWPNLELAQNKMQEIAMRLKV